MFDVTAVVATCTGVAASLGFVFSWLRWVRPGWQRWKRGAIGAWDSVVGREAVVDSITGRELSPALPGVGVRLDILTDAVAKIGDQHVRLEDHEDRIKRLELAAVERVVTRSESAAAWRAMEAVAQSKPDD